MILCVRSPLKTRKIENRHPDKTDDSMITRCKRYRYLAYIYLVHRYVSYSRLYPFGAVYDLYENGYFYS